MIPNDDTRDTVYDYYDMMSDDELIKEMEDVVGILQTSNNEDMAAALHAFINRYRDVCTDYQEAIKKGKKTNV